jgi:uncharacterized tellurite resistance protein B-like protein
MFGRNRKKTSKRKAELGFLILNLIAEIDGFFHFKENEVINDFVSKNFKTDKAENFTPSLALIEDLPKEEYFKLLTQTSKDFGEIATANERTELQLFALRLVNADNKVEESESRALQILNQELNINFKD